MKKGWCDKSGLRQNSGMGQSVSSLSLIVDKDVLGIPFAVSRAGAWNNHRQRDGYETINHICCTFVAQSCATGETQILAWMR